MQFPFFYEEIISGNPEFALSEESSRHIVQVLRMNVGDTIQITDGKGILFTAGIRSAHKKEVIVQLKESIYIDKKAPSTAIAVSLIKNTSRFEWFLEKATEVGLTEIIPLICQRTEKTRIREERMRGILISAMLQSRQVWLPVLHPPIKFHNFLQTDYPYTQKFIAHCLEEERIPLKSILDEDHISKLVLIGPEGDFSPEEIVQALAKKFIPVSLGGNRLRTETAALVAAVMLNSF